MFLWIESESILFIAPTITVVIGIGIVTDTVPIRVDSLVSIVWEVVVEVRYPVIVVVSVRVVSRPVAIEIVPLVGVVGKDVARYADPVTITVNPTSRVVVTFIRIVPDLIPVRIRPFIGVVDERINIVAITVSVGVTREVLQRPTQSLARPFLIVQRGGVNPIVDSPVRHPVPIGAVQMLKVVGLGYPV